MMTVSVEHIAIAVLIAVLIWRERHHAARYTTSLNAGITLGMVKERYGGHDE
jgi:hypothetical protein